MGAWSRLLALAGAAAAVAGLAIQLYILVTGALGPPGGLWRFFAFFTILMNILVGILFVLTVLQRDFPVRHSRLWSAATVYITMVCVNYAVLLQSRWNPQGWQLAADLLLHYATPILAVLFWFAAVPKSELRWADPLAWTGVPVLYLIYAFVRARFDGFYPYFFIDGPSIGWLNALLWPCALLIVSSWRASSMLPSERRSARRRGRRRFRAPRPDHAEALDFGHSHSIVPGGFDVASYTRRLMPATSLMMRVAVGQLAR